jgi:segregation and condensation protein B
MDHKGGTMDVLELVPIIEAMIFVAEEPITEAGLLEALEDTRVTKEQLREALDAIEREWNESAKHGIQLSQVAGGYQFRTKERCAEWLRRLNIPKPMRLSGPALETLAIVAYKQPIVRSEIERIRGVDSGAVLKTLLERRLLRIVGRRDEPGQPLLYGTTREFLEVFDLKTLKELPTLKDIGPGAGISGEKS